MKLRDEVAVKYQMKTIRPGKYTFPEFGTIDLCDINIRKADELVAKGFPFLTLREKPLEITKKESIVPVITTSETPKQPTIPVEQLRQNKTYINKLLTMNWNDLSFTDKVIFDKSEKRFLQKKALLIENSDMEREMRSLHTKMKAIDDESKHNNKRRELIRRLAALDDQKAANWQVIDRWDVPEEQKRIEDETQKAVRLALEREKRIKANRIYIYRAEKILPGMKADTGKQRERIEVKKKEVETRRQELIELGEPYV